MSAASQAAEIPELMALICGFATRQDCARLSRVRQSLFFYARPFVWKHVTGAVNLFRLLSGEQRRLNASSMEDSVAESNTPRLELYSPFIQSLEISSFPEKEYRTPDTWRSLLSHSRCPILIPNLRRITYTSPRELDEAQLDYLAFFLSPAVLDIAISVDGGHALWQSLPSASKLLDSISYSSPDLQSLRIYPGALLEDQPNDKHPELMSFTDDVFTIHEQLGRLRRLKTLVISPAVLEPDAFRAISTLPCLETLIIQSTSDGGDTYNEYDINESSFPALSRLELRWIDPHIIDHVCDMKLLIARLRHIVIEYGYDTDRNSGDAWEYDWDPADCLVAIGGVCSALTNLEYDASLTDYDLEISHSLADAFRLLPIRHLTLTTNVSTFPDPIIDWNVLLGALPLVEELRLPLQFIGHRDLRLFTTLLPQLRFLELLDVEFEDFDASPASKDLMTLANSSVHPVHIQCKFIGLSALKGRLQTAAQFLYALWPNVIVEPQALVVSTKTSHFQKEVADRINVLLNKLRLTV